MENIDKKLILRQLMTYGTIIGVLLITNAIILHSFGINDFINTDQRFITNLKNIIMGLGIYFALRHLSLKIIKDKINFGKYILWGIIIAIFFAILYSIFFVIYTKSIAPQTIQILQKNIIEIYKQMNIQSQYIEIGLKMFKNPIFLFLSNLISTTLIATTYTLIFAILNLILPKPKK